MVERKALNSLLYNKNSMLYKLSFVVLLLLITFPLVSSQEDLGIFKQSEEIQLLQTCSICDYVTLDSIKFPNGTTIPLDTNMTQIGSTFYYDFNETSQLGEYIYNTQWSNWTAPVSFGISVNGKEPADGILVVVFSLIFILIISFGIVYFLKSLVHVIQLDMDLIDCAIMMGTYFSMWLFYYFSFEYLGNAFMNNLLEIAISVGAVTHVMLPLVGFAVSFIMTNLKAEKKAQVTY